MPWINGTLLRRFGLALRRTRPTSQDVKQAQARPIQAYPIQGLDMKFRTNDWTYMAPVELMVGRPFFGYGPQSWHPLKAAVGELMENIDSTYQSSILRTYYEYFAPSTIAEAHRLDDAGPLTAVSGHQPVRGLGHLAATL